MRTLAQKYSCCVSRCDVRNVCLVSLALVGFEGNKIQKIGSIKNDTDDYPSDDDSKEASEQAEPHLLHRKTTISRANEYQ